MGDGDSQDGGGWLAQAERGLAPTPGTQQEG